MISPAYLVEDASSGPVQIGSGQHVLGGVAGLVGNDVKPPSGNDPPDVGLCDVRRGDGLAGELDCHLAGDALKFLRQLESISASAVRSGAASKSALKAKLRAERSLCFHGTSQ